MMTGRELHNELAAIVVGVTMLDCDMHHGENLYNHKGKRVDATWMRIEYALNRHNISLVEKYCKEIREQVEELVEIVDFQFTTDLCMIVFIEKVDLPDFYNIDRSDRRFYEIIC